MAKGKKTGGRKAGTPNSLSDEARSWAAKLKEKHGVDDFVSNAMNAHVAPHCMRPVGLGVCGGVFKCATCGKEYELFLTPEILRLQGFLWKTLTEYERGKPIQPVAGDANGGPISVNYVSHIERPKRNAA